MNHAVVSHEPQSGFSLIEVLVASLLMILSIFSVLAVFPQALSSTRKSGERSVLNHLAAQQSHHLRSLGLAHADLAMGTHPAQSTDSQGRKFYTVSGFAEEYSMRWTVLNGPTDATGHADPKVRAVIIETSHLVRYEADGTEIDNPLGLVVRFQTFVAE